jgi:hypothetical protein
LPLPVHVHALDGGHGRFLGIGVREDDDGVLAAKLQAHALEIRRGFLGDGAAGGHRPNKSNAANIRMAHKRGADLAVAGNDVDHAGGENSVTQLAQAQA